MKTKKIVITGGPCAGKSSAKNQIQSVFTQKGYTCFFIPETATELIESGITPWSFDKIIDFQRLVMHMQIEKEQMAEQAAKAMNKDVLIVCDRGLLDSKAYIDDTDFNKLLEEFEIDESEIIGKYEAVFHMVTAADGAQEFYTLDNNSARTETIEEAIERDQKIISAWNSHPYLRVIDNSTDFEGKLDRLISQIIKCL